MAATDNLGLGTVDGYSSTGANPFLAAENPYLTSSIDSATGDLVRAYNLAQVPAQNAAAVRSGSFGNSALGEMAGQDQNILQKNIGTLANTARMGDYNQRAGLYMQQQAANQGAQQWNLGFGRSLFNDAYGQNMQNLQTGIGLLGTLQGYNANDLNTATTAQNTPLSYWQQFANQANGFGQGYGTNTNVQGTSSNPLLGAAGGAQLGNAFSKWWSSGNNGSSGNNYSGSSNDPTAANYTNSMDQGVVW